MSASGFYHFASFYPKSSFEKTHDLKKSGRRRGDGLIVIMAALFPTLFEHISQSVSISRPQRCGPSFRLGVKLKTGGV
jgi:hypothetical protein